MLNEVEKGIQIAVKLQRLINSRSPYTNLELSNAFNQMFSSRGIAMLSNCLVRHNGYVDEWFTHLSAEDKENVLSYNIYGS